MLLDNDNALRLLIANIPSSADLEGIFFLMNAQRFKLLYYGELRNGRRGSYFGVSF